MIKTLIIVESPSKAKTIQNYLGESYVVKSSVGHVRDLATSGKGGLGIDIENSFKPHYKISKGKEKVIKEIIKESKNKPVLIATDPDREGEAIGWHIAELLNLDLNEKNRIVFSEITKSTILDSLRKPRKLDLGLVNSQEARRMLDRIIGFKLSGLMQSKLKSKSAGRVQSVALKLIVELEKEIKAFKPKKYYDIEIKYKKFNALHYHGNKKISKDEAEIILEKISNPFKVASIDIKEISRSPKKPFTTSTLQQESSKILRFSSRKTMMLAQKLYEGVDVSGELKGLITYMRTDSTRLSNSFVSSSLELIEKKFGNNYKGSYKISNKKTSQDAHEAVRPSSILLDPKYVKNNVSQASFKDKKMHDDAMKLYELIYNRTLSSLMSASKYKTTKISIESNGEKFRFEGINKVFDGFNKIYDPNKTKDIETPKISLGDQITIDQIELIEKETQPKARFTEASLIKTLDNLNIGRPSTYSMIISTLINRKYVKKEKGKFFPSDQGNLTSDELQNYFNNFINVEYTANMEEQLDLIAEGKFNKVEVLSSFLNDFNPSFENAKINMKKIEPEKVDQKCPLCNNDLVIRKSKYGEFLGCSNFPKCKYNNIEKKSKPKPKEIGKKCPKCSKPLVIRKGPRGEFIGCSGFPKCRHVEQIDKGEVQKKK